MSDLLGLTDLELSSTTLAQFLIGFSLTIILSILLKLIYVSYSNSVSNKSLIGNIFPLFGVSIFLIVITIKSSIVLSLGLVGALSIIRFRTAIKEAEQISEQLPENDSLKTLALQNKLGAFAYGANAKEELTCNAVVVVTKSFSIFNLVEPLV